MTLVSALALLAPTLDGYGAGNEWLIYLSLLLPVLMLVAIWLYGSKRTV